MLAGASSPWTLQATRTTCVSGQRRARTWPMSRQTTPVGLVMTAIVVGRAGSGRFRAGVEQALLGESRLQRLEAQRQVAEARGLDRFDVELERSLRLEQVDPAVGDDPEAGLGLERRADALVAEPDALERVALVLEREVRVTRRADGHPADFALDPHVTQPFVRSDRIPNGIRDLADTEDPEAECSGRRERRVRHRAGGRARVLGRVRVPGREQAVGAVRNGHPHIIAGSRTRRRGRPLCPRRDNERTGCRQRRQPVSFARCPPRVTTGEEALRPTVIRVVSSRTIEEAWNTPRSNGRRSIETSPKGPFAVGRRAFQTSPRAPSRANLRSLARRTSRRSTHRPLPTGRRHCARPASGTPQFGCRPGSCRLR